MLAVAVVVICAIVVPNLLSDSNTFLHNFVNHELLAVLGVILTITLASTAQIHLEFNKIEERYKKRNALLRARRGVRAAAFFLLFLFLFAVLIVVTKPMLAHAPWSQTLFNGAAIVIIIWDVLILIELTLTIFGIAPLIEED
jgi:uncharacterized membrane protein